MSALTGPEGLTPSDCYVVRLLYRASQNFDEAIKCYKNALRMDPESMQVLRDLAGLQVNLKHYSKLFRDFTAFS